MSEKTYLYVCTGCGKKKKSPETASKGNGDTLLSKLQDVCQDEENIEVLPIACLSNCDRGVSVAMTAKDKYHWLFAEKGENDDDIEAIVRAAKAHASLHDGFLEKPDRAKPVVARIPPIKS